MFLFVCTDFLVCVVTVLGLAKVATFTTNVDAENQTLINHKCVCGALNRHFCQTPVPVAQPQRYNKLQNFQALKKKTKRKKKFI